jgi:hypothetical protein
LKVGEKMFSTKNLVRPLLFSFSLLSSSFLCAGDLKAPFEYPTTLVLPKGIRNVRFKGIDASTSEKFDWQGQTISLANPLSKTVTWSDLVDPKSDNIKKGLLKGYLKAKGINMGEEVGTTTGDVQVTANAFIPIVAYGLTEKLTLALAVPIIRYNMTVDTGFQYKSPLSNIRDTLTSEGLAAEKGEVLEKMADPIRTKALLLKVTTLPLRSKTPGPCQRVGRKRRTSSSMCQEEMGKPISA